MTFKPGGAVSDRAERRRVPVASTEPVRLRGVAGPVRSCRELGCYSATLGRFCVTHAALIVREAEGGARAIAPQHDLDPSLCFAVDPDCRRCAEAGGGA